MDWATVLAGAVRAARRAGVEILRHYATPFDVERKPDGTPLTAADRGAEVIVVEELVRLTPDIPIVGEEAAAEGRVPDVSAGRFWLVDPLDGTKEFVKRNGEFTVNIGLVENLAPILGVIYAPVFETVYAAAPGFCYREFGTGERRDLGVRTAPAEGIVVAVSRSHPSARMEEFLRRYKIAGRRVSGSAIKFGFVAAGEADLYARLGPTMEWDTAAGQAIVEAAGGRMTTVDGAPFRYGKPRFENEGFIASGRSPPAT